MSISSYANPFFTNNFHPNIMPPVVPPIKPPDIIPPPMLQPMFPTKVQSSFSQSTSVPISSASVASNNAESKSSMKKFTLQIVKTNNNRGSFNTSIATPGTGRYPTFHSLQLKMGEIAKSSAIEDFQLYYRYGSNRPKILLTEDSFDDINWNDERLSFNVTENQSSRKRYAPNNDDNPKPKKISKYDQTNTEKAEAEATLREKLPMELQNKMTHADFIHASCLMIQDPQRWNLQAIETFMQNKKATTSKKDTQSNTHYADTIINLQNMILKLQEKVTNLESKANELEQKFD